MLKISDESKKKSWMRFEDRVRILLGFIPDDHLQGLSAIVMMDRPVGKWAKKQLKNARGAYFKKWNNESARIELYAEKLFGENPIGLLFYIPHAATKVFAHTLFHEIGHHRREFLPGIKKEREDAFADCYAERYRVRFENWYAAPQRRWGRMLFVPIFYYLWNRREPQKSYIKALRKEFRDNPDDPKILLKMAGVKWRSYEDYGEAEKLYRKVIAMDYEKGDVYYSLACMHFRKMMYNKAAINFQHALDERTKNIKEARKWLRKSKKLARM